MSATPEQTAALTAPGELFELAVETIDGHQVRNFVNREPSIGSLVNTAAGHGEREFLIQGERRISYEQFAQMVWAATAELELRGLKRGDRIAILGYNSIDYVVTVMAAATLGAVGVALNGWWVTDELEYALNDSGSRFLACDTALWPRIAPCIEESTVDVVLQIGGGQAPDDLVPTSDWLSEAGAITGLTKPDFNVDERDPFVILYTSGTTGRPKGCITTHGGTITQVMGILLHAYASSKRGGPSMLPKGGDQVTALLTSPLFHVAGVHTGVCTAMTTGARVVFHEGKLEPEQVLSLIESERVTSWSAVPTLMHRVVHSPAVSNYDLSSLKSIGFGGAPSSPEAAAKAREVLQVSPLLTNGYGMTETHGIITLNSGADFDEFPTSVGRPVAFFDAKLVDEDGNEVAPGERGELLISGPTITPGYWNRPEATAEALVDGWLRTGDIAYRDDEGRYFIVDRGKDVIIRGGENVYCGEIEGRLLEHPDVEEAAVFGVPHAELGEQVKAVVYAPDGVDVAALKQHVAETLARFKVPEIIEITPIPLPRNPAGKVIKSALKGAGTGVFDPELMEN
ncbi:MAG: AMP-binding protein [Acidimicrobiales bacterium]